MRARLYVTSKGGTEIASKQVNLTAREGCLYLPDGSATLHIKREGVIGNITCYLPALDKGVQFKSDGFVGQYARLGNTITVTQRGPIVIVGPAE